LGIALVAGNICIPRPATGITAFKFVIISSTCKMVAEL
jgi:hypothetical protein